MANNANIRITAEDRTRRAVQSAQRNITELRSAATSAGVAVAGITVAFGAMMKSQTEAITSTQKMAVQLGITTDSLSALSYAFSNDANISVEQFQEGLQELNVRLADSSGGTGALAEAFKQLGLSVNEVRSLRTDEMLLTIADAFNKLEDSQKAMFLAEEIFAGEFAKVVPTLLKGRDAIKQLTDEAREIGAVFSDEEAQKVREFEKASSKLAASFGALTRDLTIFVSEPATKFANWVTSLLPKVKEFGKAVAFMATGFDFASDQSTQDLLLGQITKQTEVVHRAQKALDRAIAGPNRGPERDTALAYLRSKLKTEQQKLELLTNAFNQSNNERREREKDEATSASTPERKRPTLGLPILDLTNLEESKMFADLIKQGADEILSIETDLTNEVISNKHREFNAKMAMAQQDYEARKALQDQEREENASRAEEWRATWEGVTDSFSAGVGDAFASAIMDQESLGKGLQQVMRGVAKQVISTLIQIGIQRAIQAKFGMSQTVAQTALGVKSAAILTSAYAPAALAVNIATAGGAGLAAASSSGVAATAQLAAMASTKTAGVMGQAHDGLDYVPRTGTYLLEKGERVVKKEDNQRGMMGNTYNFTIQAIDTQSGIDFLMQNEGAIASMVQSRYESNGRTGGPIR